MHPQAQDDFEKAEPSQRVGPAMDTRTKYRLTPGLKDLFKVGLGASLIRILCKPEIICQLVYQLIVYLQSRCIKRIQSRSQADRSVLPSATMAGRGSGLTLGSTTHSVIVVHLIDTA